MIEPKQAWAINAKNSIGAAGDAKDIIDESDSDDFPDADGDDAQIITAEMDDGLCNAGGEQPCGAGTEWQEPQNGNMKARVKNCRRIRAHGIKGGMAQIEDAGMAHHEVQTDPQDGIQTHIIQNINPIGIEKSRQHGKYDAERQIDKSSAIRGLHTFSATRSPRSPVGRAMRMMINTQNAMASFQAMEI